MITTYRHSRGRSDHFPLGPYPLPHVGASSVRIIRDSSLNRPISRNNLPDKSSPWIVAIHFVEELAMDALRRADNNVANAANRWQNFKHKLRHPIQHQKWRVHNQKWKIRSKLNYINPFYYLGRITKNIKFMITGRR